MMTRISNLLASLSLSSLRHVLSLAFVAGFVAFASAAPGGGGDGGNNQGSSDPQTNSSSPGDDVTSLPISSPSGTILVGSPRAVRALVQAYDGRGSVTVQRLAPGRIAATFSGNLRLTLDRSLLASGQVLVLYHGGPGEGGVLTFVSQRPTQVETERLPLPLARMAASSLTGDWLTLQAFAEHALTNLGVTSDRRSVVLTQFVRTF